MMDFDNVLSLASQNQGSSNVQKRYSLQTRPPKKDPKTKGVSAAAIQALLKKQHIDNKRKEMQMKKQKEELLAKRVELKSDRKARAMASRTKDNFRGYNGIPVVEVPKKRNSKMGVQVEGSNTEQFRNDLEDEDNYEYEQTDSESELELQPQKKTIDYSSCKSSRKPSAPPKSAPLNFADLLKLAEKKQHEPVDVKPKVIKKEERLRTADEIRELEFERKTKRYDKDVKGEKLRDGASQSSLSSTKGTLEKDQINGKLQRSKMSNSIEKQWQPQPRDNTRNSSSKSSVNDRDKLKLSHERDKSKQSLSSNATSNKMSSKPTHSQVLNKQMGTKLLSSHKSTTPSNLGAKKDYSSSLQGSSMGTPGTRASGSTSSGKKPQPTRPPQGVLHRQGVSTGAQKRGEPQRPEINATVKSNGNPLTKPAQSGTSKPNQAQPRPGGTSQIKSGSVRPGVSGVQHPGMAPGRPVNGGLAPGRVSGNLGAGPGTPRCTVVSETISSKNVGGPKTGVPLHSGITQRPGMPQRPPGMPQRPPGMPQRPPGMPQRPPGMPQRPPGMPQRPPGMPQRPPGMPQRPPGMPQRPPGMPLNRPPGTMLPPITSAYKRKYEDEEDDYDSEMDDFIDDGDDAQDEVSKHIKEIFGYDRTKYKDESDYALKFMESSWKDLQKEEARSLRLAVQEDLEEEKREEEEIKRQSAKRKKRT